MSGASPFRPLRTLVLAAALLTLGACASTKAPPEPDAGGGGGQEGIASYYAHKFHGRQTANGEIYDETKLTAAHRKLPFGTRVRVTNLENGKTVTLRINDRGPFVEGRIIDVSYRAAQDLDFISQGLAKVRVVEIESE